VTTLEDEYLRKCTSAERIGLAKGLAEGLEKGLEKGQERLNKVNQLTTLLLENGRIEDLKRAAVEPEFQKKLLEEFGLTE